MPPSQRTIDAWNAEAWEQDWDTWGWCPCGAPAHTPCRDLRHKPPGKVLRLTPHKQRQRCEPSVIPRTGWKADLHRDMIDVIVEQGCPVNLDKQISTWHWREPWNVREQIYAEIKEVGINYDRTGMPRDETWYEFQGTDCDTTTYGVEATIVLNNGKTYKFRCEMKLGDFIFHVIMRDER